MSTHEDGEVLAGCGCFVVLIVLGGVLFGLGQAIGALILWALA